MCVTSSLVSSNSQLDRAMRSDPFRFTCPESSSGKDKKNLETKDRRSEEGNYNRKSFSAPGSAIS